MTDASPSTDTDRGPADLPPPPSAPSPAPVPSPPSAPTPLDLDHEAALLIRREVPHRRALAALVAQGFPRDAAAVALDSAAAPRRARRRAFLLRTGGMVALSLIIAVGAVWWNPGDDHSPRALGFRLGLTLGWLWIALGALAMARWFVRHHGIVIVFVAIVRPLRTIRRIVMETDACDLRELELPLFTLAAGIGLVVLAQQVGQGPGSIIVVDPR